jgi:competence protein ComEA
LSRVQDYVAEEFGYEVDRRQIVVVIALVMLVLIGSGILYWRNQSAHPRSVREIKREAETPVSKKKVLVYVCGAVVKPGVYELEEGSRVAAAVNMAGGLTPDADLHSLNLAKPISDGEKVFVPKIGQVSPEPSQDSEEAKKVNLNTATIDELDQLPGVGEVIARRIISYRQKHGRFQSIDELKEIEGIGPKKFEDMKNSVEI